MTQPQVHVKPKAKPKSSPDAIEVLIDDHQKVKKMFKDYEKLKKANSNDAAKTALVEEICQALTMHMQVEEEIFYPAVRAAIDDDDLMDESDVEHSEAKELISQLEEMKPGDDHYDAKVKVLGENIDHHVEDEEEEMFPGAKKCKVDLARLGEQIVQRKKELQGG